MYKIAVACLLLIAPLIAVAPAHPAELVETAGASPPAVAAPSTTASADETIPDVAPPSCSGDGDAAVDGSSLDAESETNLDEVVVSAAEGDADSAATDDGISCSTAGSTVVDGPADQGLVDPSLRQTESLTTAPSGSEPMPGMSSETPALAVPGSLAAVASSVPTPDLTEFSIAATLPSSLDLNGAPLRFDAVGQVVEPISLIEAPMALGQSLTYRGVVTVDGFVVDTVITVIAIENLLNDEAEYTDENNTDPVLDGALDSDGNASPTTPGQVRYRMAFYHGSTYTAPGTGVPVTLLGLKVHVYDVDNRQFAEFSGFAGYQLATNTILTVTAGNSGRTRFAETNNTSTSRGSGTAYTRGRVTVRFDAVASFEYAYGVITAGDGASYSVDLSADGQPWTDNVGGAVAPEVANPTLTLSSVELPSGPTTGGQTVTLRGAGFVSGTTARFGTVPCTNVVVVSATELTCRVPAGTGTVAVTVTNPDSSVAALPSAYTYVAVSTPDPGPGPGTPPPSPATPATPALGLTLDLGVDGTLNGDQIVVSGGGLRPGSTVSIRLDPGGTVLGQVTVGADGTFRTTVTVPAGLRAGTYEVLAEGTAADGSPVTTRSSFVIPATTPVPAQLAFTGSSTGALMVVGLFSAAFGAALLAAARRRERSMSVGSSGPHAA